MVEQLRISSQDPAVESLDVIARIDAEIRAQQPTKGLIRGERIDLPTAAIQRDHLVRAQPFAPRLVPNPGIDVFEHVEVSSAVQVCPVAELDEAQSKFLELPRGHVAEGEA